jgi:AmiR/NasT family two-component response regulator
VQQSRDKTLAPHHLSGLEASLRKEVEQLRTALESRVVIEQAKGVLAERYRLSIDDAFLLLRQSARSARVRLHELAAEVVHAP